MSDLVVSGAEIRRRRVQKGWSVYRLADEIGCSHQSVEKWEDGTHQPTTVFRRAIAKALRCKEADLCVETAA